jgi:hypothetical protein
MPSPAKSPPPRPKRPARPALPSAEDILAADQSAIAAKVKEGRTLTASERAAVQAEAGSHTPATVGSIVDLAEILGVTRQTVHNWRSLPGAPVPDSGGRHQVPEWIRFRDNLGLKGGESSDEAAAKAEQIRLKNKLLKEELKKVRKENTPNEVFLTWLNNLSEEIRTILQQKLEHELPLLTLGKTELEIREAGKSLVDQIFEAFTLVTARIPRTEPDAE